MFVTSSFELLTPLLLFLYINESEYLDYFFTHFFDRDNFLYLIFGFYIFKTVLSFLTYSSIYKECFNFQANLSNSLLNKFANIPFLDFKKFTNGEVFNFIIKEPSNITFNLSIPFFTLLFELFTVFVLFALCLFIDLYLSIILSLVFSVVVILINHFTKEKISKYSEVRLNNDALKTGIMDNIINGIVSIKFIPSNNLFNRFLSYSLNSANAEFKQQRVSLIPRFVIEFFIIACLVLIFMLKGEDSLTYLATFGLIALRLMPSFVRISGSMQLFKYALPVVNSLKEILAISDEAFLGRKVKDLTPVKSLSVKDISISFGAKIITSNFNWDFKQGNIYLINGPSGKGKSTLLHYITGLISSGSIAINNENINELELRNMISYYDQNSYSPDDCLFEFFNLRHSDIGSQNYSDLLELFDYFNLSHLRAMFEKDFLLRIGRSGINLSSGENQRLSLIRAFWLNRPILVLDEPSSGLDDETELLLINKIREIATDKIIIVVSHKNALKNISDEIIEF